MAAATTAIIMSALPPNRTLPASRWRDDFIRPRHSDWGLQAHSSCRHPLSASSCLAIPTPSFPASLRIDHTRIVTPHDTWRSYICCRSRIKLAFTPADLYLGTPGRRTEVWGALAYRSAYLVFHQRETFSYNLWGTYEAHLRDFKLCPGRSAQRYLAALTTSVAFPITLKVAS